MWSTMAKLNLKNGQQNLFLEVFIYGSKDWLKKADWLDEMSTPNSIFMSISVQSWVAHARSRISNTAIVVFDRISSSTAPIVTSASVMPAARICSSDHCGSWLASSWNVSINNHQLYNFVSQTKAPKTSTWWRIPTYCKLGSTIETSQQKKTATVEQGQVYEWASYQPDWNATCQVNDNSLLLCNHHIKISPSQLVTIDLHCNNTVYCAHNARDHPPQLKQWP